MDTTYPVSNMRKMDTSFSLIGRELEVIPTDDKLRAAFVGGLRQTLHDRLIEELKLFSIPIPRIVSQKFTEVHNTDGEPNGHFFEIRLEYSFRI